MNKLLIMAMLTTLLIVGCDGNNTVYLPSSDKSNVEPTKIPKLEAEEFLGLSKGDANIALDAAMRAIPEGTININEQLRLQTLLTGYANLDEYLLRGKLRVKNIDTDIIYAKVGKYNQTSNTFDIKKTNIVGDVKKTFRI